MQTRDSRLIFINFVLPHVQFSYEFQPSYGILILRDLRGDGRYAVAGRRG